MTKPDKRAEDFPCEGPAGIVKLLDSVGGSGEELGGFHDYWLRLSGASPESGAARSHRMPLTILAQM
eukprot:10272825-Lingulodinium_polyedra.AAC.1